MPLAEEGTSVRSPDSRPGSTRPSGLARPQSTTSVSPCLPTMMLPGLMSRCSTPRLWAYSIALQTSMNRRRSLRSSSDRRPGSSFERVVGVEPLDRLLEAVAADEPHGVVGPAVAVGAQAVDRDDPGVLQPAGDLGLEQEPLAAGRVVGVVVEDLLERHLAVQLGVERDEDGPQAAPGVGAEDAEPLAVGGGRADGVAGGAVGIFADLSPGRAEVSEGGFDVGVAEPGQALAGRAAGIEAARLFSGSPPCFLR